MFKDYKVEDVIKRYSKLSTPPWIVQCILTLALTLLNGFCIATLWRWFVAPLGFPTLSFIHAIGLDFLITFIIPKDPPTKSLPFWYCWVNSLAVAIVTLVSGFIVQLFI